MTEKYILVSDEEYCYTLDTQSENYKTLEDFEKQEFEDAKKEGIDINEYEDAILEKASDNYWDWVYNNHLDLDEVNNVLNTLQEQLEPIQKICKKYTIKIEDLPGTLEEYIANDNDGYAGYSKCDGCKHDYEVKE